MKTLIVVILAAMVSIPSAFADAPKSIQTRLYKSFLPTGFDDNDQVQFAVGGSFSNGCYRVNANYKVDTDLKLNKITVYQQAYLYPGPCIDVFAPFYQVITVGILPVGVYTVVDGMSGNVLGRLPIASSKNVGPDDYLYAPVSDAYVNRSTDDNEATVVVKGVFPDSCWSLQDIRVDSKSGKDVIVVQPIAQRSEGICTKGEYPFEQEVPLGLSKGRYLLHVRSLEGQAINKVVDLF